MPTPTTAMFRGERRRFPSEQAAFNWLIEKFLQIKSDLFTDPTSAPYICKGRGGATLFAPSGWNMNQPKPLANGLWAESCTNNEQKVRILDNVAQYAGLKRGKDWDWQADGPATPKFIDVDALFADLDRLCSIRLGASE